MITHKADYSYLPGYDSKWTKTKELSAALIDSGAYRGDRGAFGYISKRTPKITYASMFGAKLQEIGVTGLAQVVSIDGHLTSYGPSKATPCEVAFRFIYDILPEIVCIAVVPSDRAPDVPLADNCCISGTHEHANEIGATLDVVRNNILATFDHNEGMFVAVNKNAKVEDVLDLVDLCSVLTL